MNDPFTGDIIAQCMRVQNFLGVGLPEKMYEQSLELCLQKEGYAVERQVSIPFHFEGDAIATKGIVDMRVSRDRRIVDLELKSATEIHPMHEGQAMAYARFDQEAEGALLINFGEFPLGIKRFVGPNGWNFSN